eukprot:2071046-Pleurochrysis_carterae.AAC.1
MAPRRARCGRSSAPVRGRQQQRRVCATRAPRAQCACRRAKTATARARHARAADAARASARVGNDGVAKRAMQAQQRACWRATATTA